MALPVKMVVILVLAVLVLSVVVYFLLGSIAFFDRATLEKDFASGCAAICSNPDRTSINLAREYPRWLSACESLHSVERGAYFACMELCGGGCVVRGDKCEYLRSFRPVVDNWLEFCNKVKTHPVTSGDYGSCAC